MNSGNIFSERDLDVEMDSVVISEISGTIAELDEKLEASNSVLLEMQEHYVSLFGKLSTGCLRLCWNQVAKLKERSEEMQEKNILL